MKIYTYYCIERAKLKGVAVEDLKWEKLSDYNPFKYVHDDYDSAYKTKVELQKNDNEYCYRIVEKKSNIWKII